MTKIITTVISTALLVGIIAFFLQGILFPKSFWFMPLNNTECQLNNVELISTGYSIKFSEDHFLAAQKNHGELLLIAPIYAETKFKIVVNFKDCKSKQISEEEISPGGGYYLYLESESVSLDRRV